MRSVVRAERCAGVFERLSSCRAATWRTGWRGHSSGLRWISCTLQPRSRPVCQAVRHHTSSAKPDCHEPTIFALSTGPGRAAIAVIRVSGSACLDIYHALCPGRKEPIPREAVVRTLYAPHIKPSRESILDSSALVLHFPAPRTVTGEDILELHVHGGPAIVKAVLAAIAKCGTISQSPIRYAEPGEFTRRAFMNNRLDLTQVEALGDTLSADTEQQRRLSVRGTTGQLSKQYEQWRQLLLYARGELEALIDFSEDQHFDESPTELMTSVSRQVQVLRHALQAHTQNAVRGELLRHGISISLLGAPNAGKSSLLNRVVGREAAIVSSEAGTTRDIVEVGVDIGGYFCRFGDTAGLRQAMRENLQDHQSAEAINRVEQEGMRRATARAADSDVVIAVLNFEPQQESEDGKLLPPRVNLDTEVCTVSQRLILEKDNVVVVVNKSDLIVEDFEAARSDAIRQCLEVFPSLGKDRIHLLSCIDTNKDSGAPDRSTQVSSSPPDRGSRTAQRPIAEDPGGIQSFLQGLIQHFAKLTAAVTPKHPAIDRLAGSSSCSTDFDVDPSIWQESLGASERHRILLEQCVSSLDAFLHEANAGKSAPDGFDGATAEVDADIVVAAEHLRAAAECLAKITGRGQAGDVEEVLGVVFEKFCVGK